MGRNIYIKLCIVKIIMLVAIISPLEAMQFVTVGEPGNAYDPIYGVGRVDYVFSMAKYKITNEEYAVFLNSVARCGDPFALYSQSMSTGLFGGINRVKKGNEYVYMAKPEWKRRPVVYISWYDLARMANWYHYDKPNDGTSRMGTTEGSPGKGAYDTRYFPIGFGDDQNYDKLPRSRNREALYWIPNENEWYKAAYYDPTRMGKRHYWDYAVRCCELPNNLPPPGDARSVNYFNEMFSIGKPYFLSEVGAYIKASSYFGTYDQNGNVWEWVEDWAQMRIDKKKKGRITKGGSATYTEMGLICENIDPLNPAHEAFVFGGRLARAYIAQNGKITYSREKKTFLVDLINRIHENLIVQLSPKRVMAVELALIILFIFFVIGLAFTLIMFSGFIYKKIPKKNDKLGCSK
jgi:formylglycine-generating enzyme